jgi:hypothetical protein
MKPLPQLSIINYQLSIINYHHYLCLQFNYNTEPSSA